MTLAHEVSASGGLRVLSGGSEGQVQKQLINRRQSSSCADGMTANQSSNSPEHASSMSNNQSTDVSIDKLNRQSLTRAIYSSQGIPSHLKDDYSTLLATAKVNINSQHGNCTARVLIDPGSEITLITSHIANQLRLKKIQQTINIRGVGSSRLTQTKGVVICELHSLTANHSVQIRAHIIEQLTSIIPKVHCTYPNSDWPHLSKLKLADLTFNIPQSIDIHLGADFYGQIIRDQIIYHAETAPIAQLFILGWLILGPVVPTSSVNQCQSYHTTIQSKDEDIQQLLTKFWVQEEVPITDQHLLSPADQQCEDFFKSTYTRHSSGRYIVRIPLSSSPSSLGKSYTTAYRCLKRQLRRLTNENEYSNLYQQFMKEYQDLGHMVAAPTNNEDNQDIQPYFLPHHGVLRPSSTTTKLRVVFNGSSPTSTGISLNDITHTGAKIQLDIFDVLLWVRQHQYVFATDITKMYRQIMVHPDDWKLQQILWLDNQNNITPFQLTTVTYGTRSAPFLAVRVLLQLVEVALSWINSNAARWKDFVRNRVVQIQDLVPDAHWRHISGKENPADCASRGITANQLRDYSLWWKGPTWLAANQEDWPVKRSPVDEAFNLEARPGIPLIAAIQHSVIQWDLVNRYSTFNRSLRITAIIIKFTSRLRHSPVTSPLAQLTPADIEKARIFWIKSSQAAHFHQEIRTLSNNQHLPPNHAFNRLTAYVDSEGVLRVGGRLQHSHLSHEAKHQAIIPRHSPITNLIIRHFHLETLHGGTQLTLTTIRQRYWIMGGRAPVKTFILRCVECARQRGIRAQQLMGQLPQSRISPSRPFAHTGIDYAGPFIIKTWRGRRTKTKKAWVCVFVCMSTSAVHLEAVGDYSTEGFLAAYRRFTSRRGNCQTIYSDCGTNFIGAEVELRRLFTRFTRENEVISRFITTNGTHWSFNPPAAPHMGGKWESAVKSLKHHLVRTIKESVLTFEEMTTLLTQIEAILNSRPLEPISDDPEDIQALTPGHFLTGSALNAVPEPAITDPDTSLRNRWQLIQQKSQHFWYRWSQSYLQKLQAISKWFFRNRTIQVGALALLTDERFPPTRWPLVRIIQLHPGQDGLPRVATIKTGSTTLVRPIAKLAILPIDTTLESQQQNSEEDNHQPRC